jgi:hypothetical protein
MPSRNGLEIRVDLKALLILAAVAVPLLLADVFFVLDRSRAALDAVVGDHLKAVAEVTASEISRYVQAKVVETGLLAAEGGLRQATEAANQNYRGLSEAVVRQRLVERDRDTALAARVLATPASAYLREYLALNLSVRRLVLTDSRGAVIGASHAPARYYEGEEDWWLAAFRDGAGAIHVGDVLYDPISRTNFVAVDVPIVSARRDRAIGVLRAIIDVEDMKPITAQVQVGAKGEALLVKGDGPIIGSRNAALLMKQKAEEMEVVAPLVAERASGYLTTSLKGGQSKFVAFADPGLSQAFPEVTWKVIVSQDLEEARAPISRVTNRALAMSFGGLLLVVALAAYFSIHRPHKLTDLEAVTTHA